MDIQQDFYVKKIFYACYVKNVVLPISFLSNIGNKKGKFYIGNKQKLRNNTSRTKTNLIQKALHNFYDSTMLSFVTLTYKDNMQDIKKAKKDIGLFFIKLKKWWNDLKRFQHLGELKYFYVYEYQSRCPIHFHVIFNRKIYKSMLAEWWSHGFNDLKVVKKGTNEFVIKYLGKYVTKGMDNVKSINQTDVGVKAYAFSRNCKNPIVVRGIKKLTIGDIIKASFNATNVFYFKTQKDSNGNTVMIGGIIESTVVNDYFKEYEDYERYVYLSALSYKYYLWTSEIGYLIQRDKDVLSWLDKIFGDKVEKIDFKKRVLH
ncbi:rolling circle replication-associated protein [Spiroplasma ixodetis]|uniref:rolling circle replication-associated protein n=1 Tax=Spiroplasma ixodetis TaxID=2141 RepID=UPI0025761FDC|nr:plectrovirus svts2 rep protein [Spiroplasma ixodetis]WJG71007.1 putative viral protein [Spiroplasma ixodetis Y32]